jgi:hypothetical protein
MSRAFPVWCIALASIALGALPARAVSTHSCGPNFAPAKTQCQQGPFTVTSSVSHDVQADATYVGTLESDLVWSGGTRTYRCTFTQALEPQCIAYGPFPTLNASVTQVCRSLVPGTSIQPEPGVGLDGVPGGAGTWSCSITI